MVITIGGFDGIHIAHQKLIQKSDYLIIIEKDANLTPGFERCYYFNKGCEFLLLKKIKNLSKEEFIHYLKKLHISKIIIGEDFKFGKNRTGNIEYLKKFFEVEVIKEIKIDGIPVHSRIIRKFLKEGKIKTANKFLGRNYKIKGIKVKGQGIGKTLLPTINIELFKPFLLPHNGVFITKTNGFNSITFIGKRSTDENFAIETHILSSKFEIPSSKLNKLIEIEFIDFLRENIKFSNLAELKKQILKDKEKAIKYFEKRQYQIK